MTGDHLRGLHVFAAAARKGQRVKVSGSLVFSSIGSIRDAMLASLGAAYLPRDYLRCWATGARCSRTTTCTMSAAATPRRRSGCSHRRCGGVTFRNSWDRRRLQA